MHVLHWYPNFLDGGGVANAVAGLAAAQAERGLRVTVAAAHLEDAPSPAAQGFELLTWAFRDPLRLGDRMPRFIAPSDAQRLVACTPDLVHVHGAFLPDNLHAPRLFDAPLVLSPHGSLHPLVFEKGSKRLKKLYFLLEKRFLYRRIAALHALSPTEGTLLERLLPDCPVACIPHGIDPACWLAPPAATPQEGPVTFTFVGRLDVFTKGLDLLIEAFARAVEARPNKLLRLQLIGPGQGKSREVLEGLAAVRGVASHVDFTGPVPASEIPAALHRTGVYIQLSRHEGFPLTVVEALLASRPVIVSKGTGLATYPEIAALPHVCVVPHDAAAAAEAMIDFAARLEALHQAARQHQARMEGFFSTERVVAKHLALYRQVLQHSPKGGAAAPLPPKMQSGLSLRPPDQPAVSITQDAGLATRKETTLIARPPPR